VVTTIQVKDQTLGRLKYYKEYSKESYDEVINKMIDEIEEGQLTDCAVADIQIALQEVKEGKGESLEDVATEFGVEL
jgi:uncharacterized protein YbjQ (UPF0145 family)